MLSTLVDNIADDPIVYLSLPIVAGFIGWVTKLLAIRMLFLPMEFRGIGPIGWQGMIPRRVGKFASMAVDTLLDDVLQPDELIDRIDVDRLVAELEAPLTEIVDDVAGEVAAKLHPRLWSDLPGPAKRAVVGRARARAPEAVRRMLTDVRAELSEGFDPRYLAVSNMVRNKHVMNDLVESVARPELRFMIWTGTLFGFLIGLAQAVVWGLTESHLVLPLFGGFVGLFTDYIALRMIFRPHEPTRLLGVIPWQGLFFRRREAFTRAYAKAGAEDLLSPRVMVAGIIEGPLMDRLLAMIHREVDLALVAELRVRPVADVAVGSSLARELRASVIARVRAKTGDLVDELATFLGAHLQLEELVAERMLGLDNEAYEGLLRPIFKQDEWKVIVLGGVLGFAVGELQVTLITHL